MADRCPHAPRIAARLADPAARLDATLAAHMPQCEACRAAASAAVRNWPTDRSPSPSLCEWLTDPGRLKTVVSPFQAAALGGGTLGALDLGPYLLLDRLGTGGMGEVYRGWHRLLRREDAVKTVRPELAAHPDAVRRFLREAESAARVRHPNVVHVYTADRAAGGGYYLAMEFVAGTDLARLVKDGGPLPVPAACEYAAQAADGLQHAFASGLVHRDVKPQNLLVTADRRTVKVTDFGLARAFAGELSEFTSPGAVLGTADYMAPEQAEDARAADTRADVYALGGTLYFLLTGQAPYAGGSVQTKLGRHAVAPVPDVTAARPGVPPAVGAVVRKCMAKRPADRYPTPGAVAAALRAVASAPTASQPAPSPAVVESVTLLDSESPADELTSLALSSGVPARPKPPPRPRRAWLWTAAGALLLATATAVVLLVVGPRREGATGVAPVTDTGSRRVTPPVTPATDAAPPGTPLPRAAPGLPWRFVGPCPSDRTDKVVVVGFLADGSVVGARDGMAKDGADVGWWEVWPRPGERPTRSGRPKAADPHERPLLADRVGLFTGRFRRFDPATLAALKPLSADVSKIDPGATAEGLDAIVATPDGQYVVGTAATGNPSRRLVVQWKAETGEVQKGWPVDTADDLKTVAVSADGHTAATVTAEGQVVVMGTRRDTKRWAGPPVGKDDRPCKVALDPPGERVFVAYDGAKAVLVWDAKTGEEVDRLKLAGCAYALAVSPDGRWLAAAGEAVSVWDLKAKPPARFDLAEHYAGQLWAAAFDDRSERLVVGGLGHQDSGRDEAAVWLWQKGP
jgi:serine/threonine protein kinase/DNA-binding beta-propeller fold protein YncE